MPGGDLLAAGGVLGPAGDKMERDREVITKVMPENPTPAFAASIALLLRYIEAEPGRVFHELATISTDFATG